MTTTKTSRKSDTFTAALTRSFKTDLGRYMCAKDEDGAIYASNGFFLVKLTEDDYNALIRPVTMTDAGNWNQTPSGTEPTEAGKGLDLVKYWTKATEDTNAETLQPSGLAITTRDGRKSKPVTISLFYAAGADFVSGYNPDFLAIVRDFTAYKAAGDRQPMTIYNGSTPAAVVMPINIKNAAAVRAVRAYFNTPTEEDKAEKVQRARKDAAAWMDAAQRLERERDELEKQLAKAQQERDQAKAAAAQNEPAADPTPAGKLDELAAAVKALGLTCTVKGQQTAAPVIWVDGDPGEHKADLEALGAKWSGKRSAWYLKV